MLCLFGNKRASILKFCILGKDIKLKVCHMPYIPKSSRLRECSLRDMMKTVHL